MTKLNIHLLGNAFCAIFLGLFLTLDTHAQTETVNRLHERKDQDQLKSEASAPSFRVSPDEILTAILAETGEIEALDEAPEPPKYFTLALDHDFIYSTNATLAGGGGPDDVLMTPVLSLGYDRELGHGFSTSLGVRQEALIYAHKGSNDYWGTSGYANLSYSYRDNLPSIFVEAFPYRYEFVNDGTQFLKGIDVILGVNHSISFNNDRSALFGGYRFVQTFTQPKSSQYDAHRIIAGLTHQFTDLFSTNLIYSYQFSDYNKIARHDNLHLVALQLNFDINEYVSLRLTGSFSDNDSDSSNFEYQSFSSGLGSSFTLRF